MILRLLESRRARRFAGGALAASVAVHAASFGAAVQPPVADGSGGGGEFISIRYILPPNRIQSPEGERVRFVAVGTGTQGWLSGAPLPADVVPVAGTREPQEATRTPEPVPEGEITMSTALYTEDQVDSAATRDPHSGGPSDPDVLREQGVQGEVLVEFAVDTTGHADPGSFAVVTSTHPLFTEAVRDALPRMLFTPAMAHGQRVRQLVRLPMKFKLLGAEKGAA